MERLPLWKALPPAQRAMIALLGVAVIIANIDQPYASVAPLHHIPTVLLIGVAPWLLRRWPLTNGAAACVFAFFLLHTLGGRYTYSYVPYDDWARSIAGVSISESFGLARNHYDRLVHFSFGLLAIPVISEVLHRHGKLPKRLSIYLALECVLAISAVYEIFEWLLTLVAAGASADAYNGQQGDMWDAQKDMALAGLGALGSVTWRRVKS
jgi:putative membrane protein